MKKILLLLVVLGFISIVHASTNCSTGCDVLGATFFDTNIDYLNWDNPAHDASLKIKSPNGGVVATKNTVDIVNWGTSQLMKFYPQVDGNYTLEVFSQGTVNNYQLKLDFNSGGVPSTYQDTNCTGTGCGGSTKIYKLNVSNSPLNGFDDNKLIPFTVKGGTVISASVRYLQGSSDCVGTCNVSIAVRRLIDNNVVAYVDNDLWTNWSTVPYTFDWNVTTDGNYALETWFEGSNANYDLNFSFTGTDNSIHVLNDYSQYIGSSLATGNTSQYFFNSGNSPTIYLGDETIFSSNVSGNKVLRAFIRFTEGSSSCIGTCNVSIAVRRLADNNIVAYVDNDFWTNWTTPRSFDWNADYNGSYAVEVWYEGSWAEYDLNVSFVDSSDFNYLYSATSQYVGSSLSTGKTIRFLFNVVNSSPIILGDEVQFFPPVKGGKLFTASVRFLQADSRLCLGTCNVSIAVRRLSDNNVIAYVDDDFWTNWATPRSFNWFADYDGNYALEIWFEGGWAQYDINVYYLDTNDVNHSYQSYGQYLGSNLTTGNTSRYLFSAGNSPPVLLHDMKALSPSVHGGSLLKASVRFLQADSRLCLGTCNVSIAVRRLSDNNVIAYVDDDLWTSWQTPRDLNLWIDYDGEYSIEVWFEGGWSQYDLNVNYAGTTGTNVSLSDPYQYIGSSLTTGNTAQYFFNVSSSPPVLLGDRVSLIYKPQSSRDINATIRFRQANSSCLGSCDASLKIKRVSDGNTVSQISTGNWATWSTPAKLTWTVASNEDYFIETWFEGGWAQYDLNVDYTDTTNNLQHFEDNYSFLGSFLGTGKFAEYYFSGGPSCGNGIECSSDPICVPVILNGEPIEKIDVVFVGSGFPDSTSFDTTINEMIDYDGNGHGLMAFEPFKENIDKFNFWKVNTVQTFSGGVVQGLFGLWYHEMSYEKEAVDLAIKKCGSINENPAQVVTLLVTPKVTSHAHMENYGNKGGGNMYLTIGQEYLDNCDVGPGCNNPWPLIAPSPTILPTQSQKLGTYGNARWQVERTFVHEFGHSFGGLADEYDTNNHGGDSLNTPNCDDNYHEPVCTKWNSFPSIECKLGCGKKDWYRPYENSIMRFQALGTPLLPTYKSVNEFELESDINSYTNTESQPSGPTNASYFIELNYNNSNFTLLNIETIPQKTNSPIAPNGSHQITIFAIDNSILYDVNFNLPNSVAYTADFNWFDINGNQTFIPEESAVQIINDFNFSIPAPYFFTAKVIQIRDSNGIIKLEIPVETELQYHIGYGGNTILGSNFKVNYSLVQQPVAGILSSTNYVCQLGPID